MHEDEERIWEVIAQWRSITELASFATDRRGYGNSDGGFGVTYPGDLDEYDREVLGVVIPKGQVEVYGYWGLPNGYEFLVSEAVYLQVLASALRGSGCAREARAVEMLINKLA